MFSLSELCALCVLFIHSFMIFSHAEEEEGTEIFTTKTRRNEVMFSLSELCALCVLFIHSFMIFSHAEEEEGPEILSRKLEETK
jgi:hypothetical protein